MPIASIALSRLKDLQFGRILSPLSTKYISTRSFIKSEILHASSTPVGPAPAITIGLVYSEELFILVINFLIIRKSFKLEKPQA